MILRAVGSCFGLALSLIAGIVTISTPVRAVPVQIDLTLSFDQQASSFSSFSGTASFYEQVVSDAGPAFSLIGTLVPPTPVTPGNPFTDSLAPTESCFGAGTCSLAFSFGGSSLDTLLSEHDTFAFASTPSSEPASAPILPIGTFEPPDPCFTGTVCEASGPIFAFSTGTQVGTWDVTIAPTPLPAALPLFATGLLGIGLLGWRRKLKAQAVV